MRTFISLRTRSCLATMKWGRGRGGRRLVAGVGVVAAAVGAELRHGGGGRTLFFLVGGGCVAESATTTGAGACGRRWPWRFCSREVGRSSRRGGRRHRGAVAHFGFALPLGVVLWRGVDPAFARPWGLLRPLRRRDGRSARGSPTGGRVAWAEAHAVGDWWATRPRCRPRCRSRGPCQADAETGSARTGRRSSGVVRQRRRRPLRRLGEAVARRLAPPTTLGPRRKVPGPRGATRSRRRRRARGRRASSPGGRAWTAWRPTRTGAAACSWASSTRTASWRRISGGDAPRRCAWPGRGTRPPSGPRGRAATGRSSRPKSSRAVC